MSKPVSLTSHNFDSTLNESGKVALVDFWAPWCGPCQMQLPFLEQLAKEVGDDYVIAKVNVDEEPQLAQRFQVRSIPMIAVVRDGRVVKTHVGLTNPAVLKNSLEEAAGVSA